MLFWFDGKNDTAQVGTLCRREGHDLMTSKNMNVGTMIEEGILARMDYKNHDAMAVVILRIFWRCTDGLERTQVWERTFCSLPCRDVHLINHV